MYVLSRTGHFYRKVVLYREALGSTIPRRENFFYHRGKLFVVVVRREMENFRSENDNNFVISKRALHRRMVHDKFSMKMLITNY